MVGRSVSTFPIRVSVSVTELIAYTLYQDYQLTSDIVNCVYRVDQSEDEEEQVSTKETSGRFIDGA